MEKQVEYEKLKYDWNKITILSDQQRKQLIEDKIRKLKIQSEHNDKYKFVFMFDH
jgi:hypothetical protein